MYMLYVIYTHIEIYNTSGYLAGPKNPEMSLVKFTFL